MEHSTLPIKIPVGHYHQTNQKQKCSNPVDDMHRF